MIDNYKIYIVSKKTYLKRKKQLNKDVKQLKKFQKTLLVKGAGRRFIQGIINKKENDLYVLKKMWDLNKFAYRNLKKTVKKEELYLYF